MSDLFLRTDWIFHQAAVAEGWSVPSAPATKFDWHFSLNLICRMEKKKKPSHNKSEPCSQRQRHESPRTSPDRRTQLSFCGLHFQSVDGFKIWEHLCGLLNVHERSLPVLVHGPLQVNCRESSLAR